MIYTEADNRRETYIRNGWSLADDDTPGTPDCEPMASGQRKRYLRDLPPAAGTQAQLH
jgi:hypothetical protein